MIMIGAPSRLHFGLFALPAATHWPNCQGESLVPARRFGGVGLMINDPGVCLSVEPAAEWSAEGPLAERALGFAQRVTPAPQRIKVASSCPPQHSGLGTGTQLALAVARVIQASAEQLQPIVIENAGTCPAYQTSPLACLAHLTGRGQRSAIGVYGFNEGGFLVEGGQSCEGGLSPLIVRHDFPGWPIVLVLPHQTQGLHGHRERQAFEQLFAQGFPQAETDALCRLALLGMLPALVERDWRSFGEALHEFNHRVGSLFAPIQGGPYAHPRLAELVAFIRSQGLPGVGQSSWGPTIFAVAADQDQAVYLRERVRGRFNLDEGEVLVTWAKNQGAHMSPMD